MMKKVRTLGLALLALFALAAVLPGSAVAASPPTVVTGHATQVKLTTATLGGTVNPNGSEVTACVFEYGSTTSYGSTAPCSAAPGSGTTPVEVSAAVTGLAQNTLYHFRVSATSAEGTSQGKDAVFATHSQLPEWGQCVAAPSHEGRFGDAGCTEPTTKVFGRYPGGYEWYAMEVSPEVGRGEAGLFDRFPTSDQPVSSTTIALADGHTITCDALRETTELEITGPQTTVGAPFLAFQGCQAPGGEGECLTTDAERLGEISTGGEWEDYYHGSGPTWHGTLMYVEGRRTSKPVVGYVWTTSPKDEVFVQQLLCEAGPVQALKVGGHKTGEELTMEVAPLNAMSKEHTLTMKQSAGIGQPTSLEGRPAKPLEAEVNSGEWTPIGVEATMRFPETEGDISKAEPQAVQVEGQLELKATP